MEKKTINIIYEFEGFYLVAVENDRTDALRTGDTIIVKAKTLYDGKGYRQLRGQWVLRG